MSASRRGTASSDVILRQSLELHRHRLGLRLALSSILPPIITVVILMLAIVPLFRGILDRNYEYQERNKLRSLVQVVMTALHDAQALIESGAIDPETAKDRTINRLRQLRYGADGTDYFWVLDVRYRMIMYPYRDDLEGRELADLIVGEAPLIRQMVDRSLAEGSAFLDYHWQWLDDAERIEPKIGYVALFEPWGWVIGTASYRQDMADAQAALYRRLLPVVALILVVVLSLGAINTLRILRGERRRQAAEDALREREEDLRLTLRSIADAVITIDIWGRVTRMNPVAEVLTGWPLAEARGRSLDEIYRLCDPDDGHPLEDPALQVLQRQEVVNPASDRILYDRNDASHRVADSAAPIMARDGAISGVILVFRDVSAQHAAREALREQEERLRQAEKLESIGRLAGGVAHDFNNQLTGIMGFAELLAGKLLADDPRHAYVDQILACARRSADLTDQLLAYARKGSYRLEVVDMHVVINELAGMLRHTIDPRIEIVSETQAPLATVYGDPGQIHNALLNLALNARDAMPDGGMVRFVTTAEPEERLRVSVIDTGPGIDPALRERIFEPFFTTKQSHKGVGMGLAAVHGIVTGMGGTIAVEDGPGGGAAFVMSLPLAEGTLRLKQPREEPSPLPPPRSTPWRIVVVDDEQPVRSSVVGILEGAGYTVTECGDGDAALATVAQVPVDLILLVLLMPRRNGADTYQALRESGITVPVLLMTGFSDQEQARSLLAAGACGLLAKPFSREDLLQAVATGLARAVEDGAST